MRCNVVIAVPSLGHLEEGFHKNCLKRTTESHDHGSCKRTALNKLRVFAGKFFLSNSLYFCFAWLKRYLEIFSFFQISLLDPSESENIPLPPTHKAIRDLCISQRPDKLALMASLGKKLSIFR